MRKDEDASWFDLPGKPGHRSLELQLTGLEELWPMVKGRSVLDVGCAEGLIARRCMDEGASLVDAIEIRAAAVRHCKSIGVSAKLANAQTWQPVARYDIVLLLSILHKLPRPDLAFARYLRHCDELCIVRLPRHQWPSLRDARSGMDKFKLARVAEHLAFYVSHTTDGPIDSGLPAEFTGWLTKRPPQ